MDVVVGAFVVILLIPVAFGVFALGAARYSRRTLRRSGTRIEADIDEVVTVLMPSQPAKLSMRGYYVKYRYRDQNGVEYRANSEVLLEDPNPLIVDGKALIAYDRRHPDRSAWIGQ